MVRKPVWVESSESGEEQEETTTEKEAGLDHKESWRPRYGIFIAFKGLWKAFEGF